MEIRPECVPGNRRELVDRLSRMLKGAAFYLHPGEAPQCQKQQVSLNCGPGQGKGRTELRRRHMTEDERQQIARRKTEYMVKRRIAGMDQRKKPFYKTVDPAKYFEDPAHPWAHEEENDDYAPRQVTDRHRAFVQDCALALISAQYIAYDLSLPLYMLFELFGDVIEHAEELATLQLEPKRPGRPSWYFDRPRLLRKPRAA